MRCSSLFFIAAIAAPALCGPIKPKPSFAANASHTTRDVDLLVVVDFAAQAADALSLAAVSGDYQNYQQYLSNGYTASKDLAAARSSVDDTINARIAEIKARLDAGFVAGTNVVSKGIEALNDALVNGEAKHAAQIASHISGIGAVLTTSGSHISGIALKNELDAQYIEALRAYFATATSSLHSNQGAHATQYYHMMLTSLGDHIPIQLEPQYHRLVARLEPRKVAEQTHALEARAAHAVNGTSTSGVTTTAVGGTMSNASPPRATTKPPLHSVAQKEARDLANELVELEARGPRKTAPVKSFADRAIKPTAASSVTGKATTTATATGQTPTAGNWTGPVEKRAIQPVVSSTTAKVSSTPTATASAPGNAPAGGGSMAPIEGRAAKPTFSHVLAERT